MTIKDFSDEEKIFAVALFKRTVDEVAQKPLIGALWAYTGVPEYFRKFMSRYGDLALEAMVAPDVAESHGLSAYVYRTMSEEKKRFLNNYFIESLNYAYEPKLNYFAIAIWNDLLKTLQ